jgi:tetratricopeptide (TPR) repeat protein
MIKKIALLAALTVILLAILSDRLEIGGKTPQEQEIRNPTGNLVKYDGPPKVLESKILQSGYWASEIEITYHHPKAQAFTLSARALHDNAVSIPLNCESYMTRLAQSHESKPNTAKVWVMRPSLVDDSFISGTVKIFSSKGCWDTDFQEVWSLPVQIEWPSFDRAAAGLAKYKQTLQDMPEVRISTGLKEFQDLATTLVLNGLPKERVKFAHSLPFTIASVHIAGQTKPDHLKPLLNEMGKNRNDLWVEYHENLNLAPYIKVGGKSNSNPQKIEKEILQQLVASETSQEEFYNSLGIRWKTPTEKVSSLVKRAKRLLDSNNKKNVRTAKQLLDGALALGANIPELYIELARYYMKSNSDFSESRPSQTGQYVTSILSDALKEFPDHANTLVLLGYVQATQNQFEQAEESFIQANRIGTDNLWLWNNWGLMHRKQQNVDEAISMYKKVADQDLQPEHDRNAYSFGIVHLARLYKTNEEYELSDYYFDKHHRQMGGHPCWTYREHARLLVSYTSKIDKAIEMAKISGNYSCPAKNELSQSLYRKWLLTQTDTSQTSVDLLIQAKSASQDQSTVFYRLAEGIGGDETIKALANVGSNLDYAWRRKTALIYAVEQNKPDAAKILLDNGANPDFVPPDGYLPPLALAVANDNVDMVQILVGAGANIDKVNASGITPIMLAEQLGNPSILKLLKGRSI